MGESILWVMAMGGAIAFAGALAFVIGSLHAPRTAPQGDEANARIAGGYYKPMARLLSSQEFSELASMGFTPKQVHQLRASRRRAFRAYLLDLKADFQCLHQEARALLRDSSADRPDLALELLRQYAGFQCGILLAHGRLLADGMGIGGMDVERLLEPVQWMHQQVELLRATAVPAA
jgi:hypothetical protein